MAETAVGFVVDNFLPLLIQEAKLLKGVHSQVLDIKGELEALQCFLKDADMKAEAEGDTMRSDGVKVWVKQLREVAFQIEDAVDVYILHLAQRPGDHGFFGSLHKIGSSIIKLKPRHQIASQIQDIKAQVHEINSRSASYGFNSIDDQHGSVNGISHNVSRYDPRKGALYLQEADLVGIESPRDELIGWLLNEKPQRCVISVVGMGGLGKTTLAKRVYDLVKEKFDCHAWISVSQSYRKEELLKEVIKQFCKGNKELTPPGIDAMDEDALTEKVREYLHKKRYVAIFDDVWQVDFWAGIEHALLDNQCCGRIVITTRSVEVANFCKISSFVYIHELQLLTQEKALELFHKKVFQFESDQGHCPNDQELEELSHKIVKRCGGLPLAIVAIAGLLSTKDKTLKEWQKLHNSLSSELESNPHLTSITRILSLSYNDLPYHLKSCYLYLGIYPEDYSIKCSRLLRQWIAEGFVKPKMDKTMEEVAQEYLTDLIHRSLVQLSDVYLDGKARTCRIHDLLHQVVLRKMEESSFCHVLCGNESSGRGLRTRRLSMVNCSWNVLHSVNENNQVRSIINFNSSDAILGNSILGAFMKNFQLMRVLDFEDGPIDSIHEDIGNLYHLKYLSLRHTKVKVLPRSIGKLVNLETLDLKQSFVLEIPAEIKRLHKLRHLLAYKDDRTMHFCIDGRKGIRVQEGIGSLESLQKLYRLDATEMGVELIKELGKLTQLRRLGITKLRSEDGRILGRCIENMKQLESLEVRATSEDDMIDLESILSPPEFLQHLYLSGRLRKLPEWIRKLQNLTEVKISWSKLEDDPLQTFKHLPNSILRLMITRDAYVGGELRFEKGMFVKLKQLNLGYLSGLKWVVIEEGSLVNLENLIIWPSPQLMEVPSGIQHLKNLKYLDFYDMSEEFIKSIHPQGGQHYHIVQHIPRVLIHSGLGGGKYETCRLGNWKKL